nr:uncharacterized protein LOC111418124 isoform X1 [Onthophagus taurus]
MGFYHDIFPVVNSIIEYFLNVSKLNKIGDGGIYLKKMLSLIVVLITFTGIAPFVIFRSTLQLFLKFFYGKNYLGMLSGNDRPCLDPSCLFLNVYILEHDGTINEIYEDVKNSCNKLFFSHTKFSSVMKSTLGYQYFVANQIGFDEILRVESFNEDHITKEDLSEFIDEKYSYPLEKKLWEVTIINKPIIYNKHSENRNCYAIIIKITHTMSDAIYLSSMLQKYFFNKCDNKNFIKALKSAKTEKSNRVKNIVKYITIPIKLPPLNKTNPKSISSVYIEENQVYFNMVREIRRKHNVTFPQVIFTAAMCSFSNYLKNKHPDVEKVRYGYTIRPETENINQVLEGKTLINDLSFMTSTFKCNNKNIKETLMNISKSLNEQKRSTDGQAMYLLQQLGTHLPYPILKLFFKFMIRPITVGFSNIPGINDAFINGKNVQDGFVYVNSYLSTKFLFQIYTYDGRIQINLTATNNTVDTRMEIDGILRGIFENINILYNE